MGVFDFCFSMSCFTDEVGTWGTESEADRGASSGEMEVTIEIGVTALRERQAGWGAQLVGRVHCWVETGRFKGLNDLTLGGPKLRHQVSDAPQTAKVIKCEEQLQNCNCWKLLPPYTAKCTHLDGDECIRCTFEALRLHLASCEWEHRLYAAMLLQEPSFIVEFHHTLNNYGM